MNHDYSYRDAANLLDAIRQLLSHFSKYNNVPMISETKGKLEDIQTHMKKHVHKVFREIGQIVDHVADAELVAQSVVGSANHSLSDACVIVDALGMLWIHCTCNQ